MQQQQSPPAPATTEAPPKQVALAMDRLNHAGRLIADIRLGADRLLEAMFMAGENQQSNKPFKLIVQEESSMRQYLQDLRTVGNFSQFLSLILVLSLLRFRVCS